MSTYTFRKRCGTCKGTGKIIRPPFEWIDEEGNSHASTEIDCPNCQGNGSYEWGTFDSTLKCPTSLVLENTDYDEYTALTAAKKTFYALFISAGTLDMTEGSKANAMFLTTIFPPGTASNTAITSALAGL